MAGWWYRATAEQKLAQIDAAIELGMTSTQVAMNCGARRTTVCTFANYHNRRFVDGQSKAARSHQKRTGGIRAFRNAYFKGEPVDAWSVE